MSPFGGPEFPGGGGGSGGTVLPTPSQTGEGVIWNGTMWVATSAQLVTSKNVLGQETRIDGLSGSADVFAGGANDDEFNQDFNGVSAPWTNFNAPDISNTSDALSYLHLRKNATGSQMAGIYRTPPTAPYTMTAKLSDVYLASSPNRCGLFICSGAAPAAAAGTILDVFLSQNSGSPTFGSNSYTGYTGTGAASPLGTDTSVNPAAFAPCYFRIIVTDSTHAQFGWSKNGQVWYMGAVASPGFGALPGSVGLHVNCVAATGRGEAFFDWIRFT